MSSEERQDSAARELSQLWPLRHLVQPLLPLLPSLPPSELPVFS